MKFALATALGATVAADCTGDKDASCPTLSCNFCGQNVGGCAESSCGTDDFERTLTDCSGGLCHYHCACKNPVVPTPPAPTPPAPTPAPVPPAPTPILPGISKDSVTIGGLVCDGIQTGSVFYPNDRSRKYPLLAFAHGWTEGGQFTDGNYKDVIESVAKSGYVVIAHHSGLVNECQKIYPKDQQRALAFIKETVKYADMVDWDVKHGIYGHSMGGGATGDNAGNRNAIATYNLGAAVLLHPVATNTRTLIPALYTTGSADTICSPESVQSWSRTATTPMIFAEMKGADHFECQSKEAGIPCPAGWTNYVINWFDCHLKNKQNGCDAAYSVCTHPSKPMSKTRCEPANAHNSSVTV